MTREPYTEQAKAMAALSAENGLLRDENERLKVEIGRLKAVIAAEIPTYEQGYNDGLGAYRAEVTRLRADVAALSKTLNGIANRPDFADKVLAAARAALEPKP